MLLDKGIAKAPSKRIWRKRQVEIQSSNHNAIIQMVGICQLPCLTTGVRSNADHTSLMSSLSEPAGNAIRLPFGSPNVFGWKMMNRNQCLQIILLFHRRGLARTRYRAKASLAFYSATETRARSGNTALQKSCTIPSSTCPSRPHLIIVSGTTSPQAIGRHSKALVVLPASGRTKTPVKPAIHRSARVPAAPNALHGQNRCSLDILTNICKFLWYESVNGLQFGKVASPPRPNAVLLRHPTSLPSGAPTQVDPHKTLYVNIIIGCDRQS